MAKALRQTLVDIADAIREKNTSAGQMTSQEMPTKIREIQTGGGGGCEAPYEINNFYPARFTNFKGTSDELNLYLKAGGTKGLYTDMSHMFEGCSNITTIPVIDTSNVTNTEYMFSGCTNLNSIPVINTSKATNMNHMFAMCNTITEAPAIDTSSATNISRMFGNCVNLTKVPELNTQNVTGNGFEHLFYYCSALKTIPVLNVSKTWNLASLCNGCTSLEVIPAIDVATITSFRYTFSNCSALKEFHATNINADLDLHSSTQFTREALVEIIGNLVAQPNPESPSKKLTIGATNKGKLTPEDIAVATAKGWNIF